MANMLIGVISDTHGLIRPQAVKALEGCELILHAGDIGTIQVIEELRKIAPVAAVRGNCDRGQCAGIFASDEVVEAAGHHLYLIHDLDRMEIEPAAAGLSAVISGHTHRPASFRHNRVLYLNPGSAGPRRFSLPIGIALLRISGEVLQTEFIDLLANGS